MEIAAWWPCATAQMMFFGPNAASPPKNTFGLCRSHRQLHRPPACPTGRTPGRCRARSTGRHSPGPTATSTSSHSKCWSGSPVGTSRRRPRASRSAFTFSNITPVSLPSSMRELLRHQHVEDRDVLVDGVLLFPGRRLHFLEAGADDDLHVLAAQPARRAAAIHGGIAAAQHDHALADLGDMAERDRGQPVDADMDVGSSLVAARDRQVAPARRAAADEDRVVVVVQQRLQAVDPLAEPHSMPRSVM